MAEVTNHILFAKKIMKEININNKNLYIYSVGPDCFYFKKNTYFYAKKMHRNKSRLFFEKYITYIKENNLEKNIDVISSLYGFITHYVVDYIIHPYVFYKGGIYDRNDKSTLKYLDGHRSIEMGITNYYYGKNINKFKMYEYMNIKKNLDIKKTLDYTFKSTFNIEDGYNKYLKSYKNMKIIYKYFRYDKKGIKKTIYKIIDLFRKNRNKFSLISFYNIQETDLNKNHKVWLNPCDNKVRYNKSVDDLFNECEKETIKLINLVNNVINNKKSLDDFKKEFPNVSYLSGQDCNSNTRLEYFE